jgi:lipoyl(octanoyl) transferase
MTDEIFDVTKSILTDWGLNDLSTENVLMGIWLGTKKLASMGIAIEKLTTFHGMALNLFRDEQMSAALEKLNPCGLSATTYTSVDQYLPVHSISLEAFTDVFIQRINHAWE